MRSLKDPRGLPMVLAVDDEPAILALLKDGLGFHGFTVLSARSCVEATDLLRAHWEAITVALIDLDLPDLDGLATLQALLQVKPSLRCCLMSSDLASQDQDVKLFGVACIIGKPIILADLVRSLG